jgi:4-aminobutyrate aminotransferase
MITNVKGPLPGPKSQEYLALSEQVEPRCMTQQAPIVWESAQGCVVKDVDGNTYLDFTSGVLVTNVGHCHPQHVQRLQEAVARLMNCYDFPTPDRVTLAKRLVDLMPDNIDQTFLLTTGSEATEAAMRVAKRFTGQHEIIAFYGGFHGRTYGAMSMAGKTGTKKNFGPVMPGVIHTPFPYCFRCPFQKKPEDCGRFCLEFMDTVIDAASTGDLAALIIEPYQGGAGFIFPPEGYLTQLQAWCRERDVIFILDEVQSSFGRTGTMFAFEWENLTPNLICLGKGIGSGMPTAALMCESRIMASLAPGEMSSTTGGNPLSCAAGLAVLDIFEEEDLVGNANRIGAYLKQRFLDLQAHSDILGDIRGRGLVMGLEFVTDRQTNTPSPEITMEVINRCCNAGLLVGRVGIYGNVIRIAPPLVMSEDEAEEAADIMEKVIGEVVR